MMGAEIPLKCEFISIIFIVIIQKDYSNFGLKSTILYYPVIPTMPSIAHWDIFTTYYVARTSSNSSA